MLEKPLIYITGGRIKFKMNIIYITTSFPKPEDGATIYTDLAEELNINNHDITVVVSDQNQRTWSITSNIERNLRVIRVGVLPYYNVNMIIKGISSLTASNFIKRGIRKILKTDEFDLLLYESPPTTNVNVINWAKQYFNCRTYLMLKDIFPQNAIDLHIIKENSLLHKFFRFKEKKIYEVSDIIGCMSQKNIEYLLEHNILNPLKVKYFPNTKKIHSHSNETPRNTIRKKYNLPLLSTIVLFGGNMGKPQFIELLTETIIELKNNQELFFLFIGRGTEKYLIENIIEEKNISNAKVIENLHRDEYELLIKSIDVGLVVLHPSFTIPNYPSRILSYMENSIPVLVATDNVSDIKELVEKANNGFWVYSGDKDSFINRIKELSSNKELELLGKNGFEYMLEHFAVSKSVDYIEQHYKELIENVQK